MKKIIKINGMSCEHCKKRVENKLSELEGILNVNVDLDSKIATLEIEKNIDNTLLKDVVEDLGYEVEYIK